MNTRTAVRIAAVCVTAVSLAFSGCGQDEPEQGAEKQPEGQPEQKTEKPTKGKEWTVPELGMKFVYVKPGSFKMGWQGKGALNKCTPVHKVKISKGFWIGKYEVTQAEYKKLMGENPSHFEGANRPVENVSWRNASKFCKKLTERERQAGRLPEGYEYCLPTEAEWEYAARGGQKNEDRYKYSGSDDIDKVAWYGDNSGDHTHQVGQKQANDLGAYDMSGNVREWCYDWYDSDYYGDSPRVDPVNTSEASCRVSRGGSWYYAAQQICRSANRGEYPPDETSIDIGFRVVLAPPVQR